MVVVVGVCFGGLQLRTALHLEVVNIELANHMQCSLRRFGNC